MIPLLVVAGLIGLAIRSARPTSPSVRTGNVLPRPHHRSPSAVVGAGRPVNPPIRISAVDKLAAYVRRGEAAPQYLLDAAICEAWEQGDLALVRAIADIAFKKRSSEESKPESETVSPPPASAPELESYPCPLVDDAGQAIPEEEWTDFVNAMKVRPENFTSEKYVGAFAHNRTRLKELGLEEPASIAEQYEAFAKDIADHYLKHGDVIQSHAGDVIKVKGEEHAITMSGVLGLMKAAGAKNAVHWLQHPEDHEKFPNTTNVFLRTNGCF